jgi:hypothetical protein
MTKFLQAFIKAQSEIHNAQTDSYNPGFKSRYASLESVLDAVKPTLNKYGIAILQPMIIENEKAFIVTKLIHESGELIESKTPIIFDKQTAQAMGSGISYARRYALASLVCIGGDDDDGNAATESKPQGSPQEPKAKPAAKPLAKATQSGSNGDFVIKFGPDKGKSLGELGAGAISAKIAQLKFSKTDFAKSDLAKEFLTKAEAFLKGNQDPLDAALSNDEPPPFDDTPWPK